MARKIFSAEFKAKVAVEAIKNELSLQELAKKYNVHPTQIKDWKVLLISQSENLFLKKNGNNTQPDSGKYIEALERKAGQQAIEIDFLKKNVMPYPKANV
jgi:transposase